MKCSRACSLLEFVKTLLPASEDILQDVSRSFVGLYTSEGLVRVTRICRMRTYNQGYTAFYPPAL